mgnify:FL=1|jgi:hypothetical protein|nr:MAG TPA: Monokaryotic chloroplast 1 junction resolvase, DNA BINDING.86A [Caudoviricetes sp.]
MPPTFKRHLPVYANYIVGVDPGVTTGIAILGWDDDKTPSVENVAYTLDQFTYGNSGSVTDNRSDNEIEMIQGIAESILVNAWGFDGPPVVWLVMENFTPRQANSSPEYLSPVRIASGVIAAIISRVQCDSCLEYPPIVNLVYQSPADAKNICTDERLEKWGFKQKNDSDTRHARDGLRHAVAWLRKLSGPYSSYQNLYTSL